MKLTFQCRRQENKLSWTRKVSGSKSPKEVRKLGLLILAGREFYVARTVCKGFAGKACSRTGQEAMRLEQSKQIGNESGEVTEDQIIQVLIG